MNDPDELLTGGRTINELMRNSVGGTSEDLQNLLTRVMRGFMPDENNSRVISFLACACKRPDNLTMWRSYTGDKVGFAVGLLASQPLYAVHQEADPDAILAMNGFIDPENRAPWAERIEEAGESPNTWQPTIYDTDAQRSVLEPFVREMMRRDETGAIAANMQWFENAWRLTTAAQVLKNKAYEDEQEYRIVFNLPPYADARYVKFRSGPHGVVPYVELGVPKSGSRAIRGERRELGKLPIVGVAVGPTPYQEEAAEGVRLLLRTYGYGTIDPTRIDVPFRR